MSLLNSAVGRIWYDITKVHHVSVILPRAGLLNCLSHIKQLTLKNKNDKISEKSAFQKYTSHICIFIRHQHIRLGIEYLDKSVILFSRTFKVELCD